MWFQNKKKKYFKHKLDGVQKMIWDFEFKREKTLVIREEVRREYDGTNSKIHLIKTKVKAQLKDPALICEVHNPEPGKEKALAAAGKCTCIYNDSHLPIADIERLYDEADLLQRDSERYVAQMKQMDIDVNGSPKTNEYPEGHDGIKQQLESLRELKIMIQEYLKKI